MPNPDVQLLLATHGGDPAAARALWHGHAARLVAYARSIVGRRGTAHDAEDIVQTVFCRVMTLERRKLAQVRDVHAWLAQIARRTSLNWLRSLRRDAARRRGRAEGADAPRMPQKEVDPGVAAAVDSLPARLREVVVLRHIAGLTFDQIELATGVNRNTAAARYRSAVALLRESVRTDAAGSIPSEDMLTRRDQARQDLVHHE